MPQAQLRDGLTFDDVLLEPGASSVHPNEVDLSSRLTQDIRLTAPIVSSPMDTVTEHRTAITMAREGGLGFVHKNFGIEAQAAELAKVKRSESGLIVDPITLEPEESIHEALDIMHRNRISGLPVVRGEKLVGIVTNRDLRFVKEQPVWAFARARLPGDGAQNLPRSSDGTEKRAATHDRFSQPEFSTRDLTISGKSDPPLAATA